MQINYIGQPAKERRSCKMQLRKLLVVVMATIMILAGVAQPAAAAGGDDPAGFDHNDVFVPPHSQYEHLPIGDDGSPVVQPTIEEILLNNTPEEIKRTLHQSGGSRGVDVWSVPYKGDQTFHRVIFDLVGVQNDCWYLATAPAIWQYFGTVSNFGGHTWNHSGDNCHQSETEYMFGACYGGVACVLYEADSLEFEVDGEHHIVSYLMVAPGSELRCLESPICGLTGQTDPVIDLVGVVGDGLCLDSYRSYVEMYEFLDDLQGATHGCTFSQLACLTGYFCRMEYFTGENGRFYEVILPRLERGYFRILPGEDGLQTSVHWGYGELCQTIDFDYLRLDLQGPVKAGAVEPEGFNECLWYARFWLNLAEHLSWLGAPELIEDMPVDIETQLEVLKHRKLLYSLGWSMEVTPSF